MDVVKGVGVGGGGRVGVGVAVEDDMGDGMQCSDHPYRNNPGGICAFCLQEKLGKLVSSSFPLPIRVSSSSSSSPSFRSDNIGSSNSVSDVVGVGVGSGSSLSLAVRPTSRNGNNGGSSGLSSHYQEYYSSRRAKIPFLLAKKKKIMVASSSTSSSASDHRDIVFKRSKSTATPRTRRTHFLDNNDGDQDFSPSKRNGFWSFLYHSSKPNPAKKTLTINPTATTTTTTTNGSRCVGSDIHIVLEEDDSPNSQATASAASSFERKVSRSRSVGCGSRSFSGDFFERISTGFGDCTLRRVESQREGKQKVTTTTAHHHMKEKVKCGGIFGGFIITSSSSSSSSSSYWVSSSAEEINGKPPTGSLAHGRTKSWGWAFASPMRAFASKPSSKDGKRDLNKKTTPDLTAIPSLLAVGG